MFLQAGNQPERHMLPRLHAFPVQRGEVLRRRQHLAPEGRIGPNQAQRFMSRKIVSRSDSFTS